MMTLKGGLHMENSLNSLFSETLEFSHEIVSRVQHCNHPLVILFQTSILYNLLLAFSEGKNDLENI